MTFPVVGIMQIPKEESRRACAVTAIVTGLALGSTLFSGAMAQDGQQVIRSNAGAGELQRNRELMNSGVIESVAKDMAAQNKATVDSVNDEVMDRVKAAMPRFDQFASGLVHGKHVTVSKEGDDVIFLIMSLPRASTADRVKMLGRLQEFSRAGVPEALNFMGFVCEHGIYGAKKDLPLAIKYYDVAAKKNYQPAIYNLALAAAYGKGGTPDPMRAKTLVGRAWSMGGETSYRICGLGSFLAFRAKEQVNAAKLAKGCASPLAGLAGAAYGEQGTLAQRVDMARDSLSVGINDGFNVIAAMTRSGATNDKTFTYCKYKVTADYMNRKDRSGLKDAARHCYEQTSRDTSRGAWKTSDDEAVQGIVGFAAIEVDHIKRLRASNHFHYSWGVPYLPFPQPDAVMFESAVKGGI